MPTTSAPDLGSDDSTAAARLHQLHISVLSTLSGTAVIMRPTRFINPLLPSLTDVPLPVLLNQPKKRKKASSSCFIGVCLLINGFLNGAQNSGLIVLFTTKISGSAGGLRTTSALVGNGTLIIETFA